MPFTKLGAFSKKPSDLPDVPSPDWTPNQIRDAWQVPLDELKATQDKLVDDLNNNLTRWVTRDKVALGAIGTDEIDPSILSQPTSAIGQQAKFEAIDKKIDWVVNVKEFGAKGDGITDDTQAFNDALTSAVGITVFVPLGKYVIKGQINIPKYARLIGDRIGLTQGAGADTVEGGDRRNKLIESTLSIEPTDISVTPIVMDKQSILKGVYIVYPNQDPAVTTEDSLIQYAVSITASNGCNIENIRTWGAWDFIKGTGEAIRIANVYGYTLGKAIEIRDSSDVCRLENIHLNPNVVRPVQALVDLAKSRTGSIAFYFENCDGVQMQNIHVYGYRTAIKEVGGNGGSQVCFKLVNFFFDAVGLAFDLDTDSAWGDKITNGEVICGFCDDANYAGFVRLNKTMSQSFITPILINNVTVLQYSGGVTPSYYINFVYLYSFDVRCNNVSYSGSSAFISSHGSYAYGMVRNGNSQLYLEKQYQLKNWVKNADLQLDTNSDGTPDDWTKDVGTDTLTVSKDISGFMKLTTTNGLADYRGLYHRLSLPTDSKFTVIVKAKSWNTRSNIWVKHWNAGFTNLVEENNSFNGDGIAVISVTALKSIVDIFLSPGNNAGDSLVIESVQLVTDTRRYLL